MLFYVIFFLQRGNGISSKDFKMTHSIEQVTNIMRSFLDGYEDVLVSTRLSEKKDHEFHLLTGQFLMTVLMSFLSFQCLKLKFFFKYLLFTTLKF